MKHKIERKTPIDGDTRIISRFALFPKTMYNFNDKTNTEIAEVRWLERYKILQRYRECCGHFSFPAYWEDIEFIEDKKESI